jgi:hypothetical protein
MPPLVWPPKRSCTLHNTGSQGSSTLICATPAQQAWTIGPVNASPITPANLTPTSRPPLSNTLSHGDNIEMVMRLNHRPHLTNRTRWFNSRGHKHQRAFAFEDEMPTIEPIDSLSRDRWNELARESSVLLDGCDLWSFRVVGCMWGCFHCCHQARYLCPAAWMVYHLAGHCKLVE